MLQNDGLPRAVERAAVRIRVDAWEGHNWRAHVGRAGGESEHGSVSERQQLTESDCVRLRQLYDALLPD